MAVSPWNTTAYGETARETDRQSAQAPDRLTDNTITNYSRPTDIIDIIVSSPLNTPIHVVALVSGGISLVASVCTLFILYRNADGKRFFRRKQGQYFSFLIYINYVYI